MSGPWINGPLVDPGAIGITGGTINGVTFSGINVGVDYPATVGGIPLIALSSGSVSAAGVISAITALPAIYPDAYCYFPANALATAIAAGWYYCTFSSTTAGVAFLNVYASGTPTIPGSPTAVTDGKGTFVSDISTKTAHSFSIPPNTLGASGAIRFRMATMQTNSAGTKTINVKLGSAFCGIASVANVAVGGIRGEIANTGSAAKQLSSFDPFWVNPSTINTISTVDTTALTTLTTTITTGTVTDNLVLLPPTVEIIRAQ